MARPSHRRIGREAMLQLPTFSTESVYCESMHAAEDVLYSGSEDEYYDSPSARVRCYEDHARRFLQGNSPFLISASLKGPFGKDSGWVNPWSGKGGRAVAESQPSPQSQSRQPQRPLPQLPSQSRPPTAAKEQVDATHETAKGSGKNDVVSAVESVQPPSPSESELWRPSSTARPIASRPADGANKASWLRRRHSGMQEESGGDMLAVSPTAATCSKRRVSSLKRSSPELSGTIQGEQLFNRNGNTREGQPRRNGFSKMETDQSWLRRTSFKRQRESSHDDMLATAPGSPTNPFKTRRLADPTRSSSEPPLAEGWSQTLAPSDVSTAQQAETTASRGDGFGVTSGDIPGDDTETLPDHPPPLTTADQAPDIATSEIGISETIPVQAGAPISSFDGTADIPVEEDDIKDGNIFTRHLPKDIRPIVLMDVTLPEGAESPSVGVAEGSPSTKASPSDDDQKIKHDQSPRARSPSPPPSIPPRKKTFDTTRPGPKMRLVIELEDKRIHLAKQGVPVDMALHKASREAVEPEKQRPWCNEKLFVSPCNQSGPACCSTLNSTESFDSMVGRPENSASVSQQQLTSPCSPEATPPAEAMPGQQEQKTAADAPLSSGTAIPSSLRPAPSTPETKQSSLPTPDLTVSIKSFRRFRSSTPTPPPRQRSRQPNGLRSVLLPPRSKRKASDGRSARRVRFEIPDKEEETPEKNPLFVYQYDIEDDGREEGNSNSLQSTATRRTLGKRKRANSAHATPSPGPRTSSPPPQDAYVSGTLPSEVRKFQGHFASVANRRTRQQLAGQERVPTSTDAMAEMSRLQGRPSPIRQETLGKEQEVYANKENSIDDLVHGDEHGYEDADALDDVQEVLENLDDFLGMFDVDTELAKAQSG